MIPKEAVDAAWQSRVAALRHCAKAQLVSPTGRIFALGDARVVRADEKEIKIGGFQLDCFEAGRISLFQLVAEDGTILYESPVGKGAGLEFNVELGGSTSVLVAGDEVQFRTGLTLTRKNGV